MFLSRSEKFIIFLNHIQNIQIQLFSIIFSDIHRLPCRIFTRTLTHDTLSSFRNPILPVFSPSLSSNHVIKFGPNQISLDFGIFDTHQRVRRKEIFDVPLIPNKIIENPVSILNEIDEISQRISDIRLPDAVKRNVDDRGMQAQVKKNNRVSIFFFFIYGENKIYFSLCSHSES